MDSRHVVIGSQDDKFGCTVWDLSGFCLHNFGKDIAKLRVNDLAISPNGQRLVILSESSIIVFDFDSYEKIYEWQVDDVKLMSVTISQDSRHMLVSMSQAHIQLMEIDSGKVIHRFEGHQQKDFILRSAFGGADENFVVSGSEGMLISVLSRPPSPPSRLLFNHMPILTPTKQDSRIYIWRSNGLLIEALDAHAGCVNSVAWHPRDPSTFASAGDDCRVKIWRPLSAPPFPAGSGGSNGCG